METGTLESLGLKLQKLPAEFWASCAPRVTRLRETLQFAFWRKDTAGKGERQGGGQENCSSSSHRVFSRSLPCPGALLWLLFSLAFLWQLSLSCIFKPLPECQGSNLYIQYIFNGNINFQELQGTLRSQQLMQGSC